MRPPVLKVYNQRNRDEGRIQGPASLRAVQSLAAKSWSMDPPAHSPPVYICPLSPSPPTYPPHPNPAASLSGPSICCSHSVKAPASLRNMCRQCKKQLLSTFWFGKLHRILCDDSEPTHLSYLCRDIPSSCCLWDTPVITDAPESVVSLLLIRTFSHCWQVTGISTWSCSIPSL